jgi:hypothetical protein
MSWRLPGGTVLLLVGAHADVAERRLAFILHRLGLVAVAFWPRRPS